MLGGERIALVLGAGASWAAPAGRPLFGTIAGALFEGVGVELAQERRRLMAPEALLSRLADRGIDIDVELRRALAGGLPNALHYAAATALLHRHAVWTTNFDELVEIAAKEIGVEFHPILPGGDPDCPCGLGHIVKVHGTLTGDHVVARSEEVLEPLPRCSRQDLCRRGMSGTDPRIQRLSTFMVKAADATAATADRRLGLGKWLR